MRTRRNFIQTAGRGVAAAAVVPGLFTENASAANPEKQIRIGIIGAENSHTIGFGKLFNIDKKFPEIGRAHV